MLSNLSFFFPLFQYNICFGSTLAIPSKIALQILISIQHLFRFDPCLRIKPPVACCISIQHLFRFDDDNLDKLFKYDKFQYNICFGSTFS